jgi:hypothetical protein
MKRHGVDGFRPELSPEQVDRLWQGMESAGRRRQARRVVAAGVASSAFVAALMSLVLARPSEPARLSAQGLSLEAGVTLPLADGPVRFDEGSRIQALGPAQVEVVTHRPDRFVTLLVRGAIAVEVTPGGPRAWAVETDLASIEVVGTAFEVRRDDSGLEVRVGHGLVLVSGERVAGRLQRLRGGEVLRIPALASPVESVRAATATRADDGGEAPAGRVVAPTDRPRAVPLVRGGSAEPIEAEAPVSPPSTPSGSPTPTPTPRPTPTPTPTPEADLSPAPIEAVLDRVSALRAGGARASAEALLRAAIARSDSPAEAAALAFELGRRLAEEPGRAADAAAALRLVERPGAPPELVEAARGLRRQLEPE